MKKCDWGNKINLFFVKLKAFFIKIDWYKTIDIILKIINTLKK